MNTKRITDLIRADIITMNGGKNSLRTTLILSFLFFTGIGFIIHPIAGLIYTPLVMGGMFVPMIFANEQKYHSEKMFCVMPVERKELVRSRFIMTIGLFVIVSFVSYLLMLLSAKIGIYRTIMGDIDVLDIYLKKINQAFGSNLTPLGLENIMFFSSFSVSLNLAAGTLRKYFRDSKKILLGLDMGKSIKSWKTKDYFGALIVLGAIVFVTMAITGVLPIQSALMPIIAVLLQTMKIMNGSIFCAIVLTLSVFSALFSYACTLMEYEDKEI